MYFHSQQNFQETLGILVTYQMFLLHLELPFSTVCIFFITVRDGNQDNARARDLLDRWAPTYYSLRPLLSFSF